MRSLTPAAIPAAVTTKRQGATPKATPYAIIGNGWRSSVFIRMAYLMPERFELVGVVTRRAEAGAVLERDWGVETYRTIDDLLDAERPDFVVLSVPWPATPQLTRQLVQAKVRVLAETPPAPLWRSVRLATGGGRGIATGVS
jgi:predicted dehydrogenase